MESNVPYEHESTVQKRCEQFNLHLRELQFLGNPDLLILNDCYVFRVKLYIENNSKCSLTVYIEDSNKHTALIKI